MSAASLLEKYDVDTIVLEASDRIGGRLHTVKVIMEEKKERKD